MVVLERRPNYNIAVPVEVQIRDGGDSHPKTRVLSWRGAAEEPLLIQYALQKGDDMLEYSTAGGTESLTWLISTALQTSGYLGDREDIDPAFLFLQLAHEHRRPYQQEVCHSISVHIQRAEDAPEVRPDLREQQAQ